LPKHTGLALIAVDLEQHFERPSRREWAGDEDEDEEDGFKNRSSVNQPCTPAG
jgi:hypothetical protein